jgi:hypothetical protein
VAVDDWLLDDLNPADTGVQLTESEHVMATRLGENAFLMRLERFLLAHKARRRPCWPRRADRDPP